MELTLWSSVGIALAVTLGVLCLWALVIVSRTPFRALGILVAGMAFHNFAIMTLLSLDTPGIIVRVVQGWKEVILALLLMLAVVMLYNWLRSGRRLRLTLPDYIAIAFTLTVLIYLILPESIMPEEGSLAQRLVSVRIALLMPLLYAFGRVFRPSGITDQRWVTRAVLGAGMVVGLFGLFELWFVPTTTWFEWGVKRFSDWLGYQYAGPGGLPENFFQTTGTGLLLRRMVSTYISPLGIAYTGLLVVPMGVLTALRARENSGFPRWVRWGAFSLLITSILLSVTRGALLSLVVELALLCLLLRSRRVIAIFIIVTLLVGLVLVEYVRFGPLLTSELRDVRPPAGYALVRNVERFMLGGADTGNSESIPGSESPESGELIDRALSAEDPSARGHLAALLYGFDYLTLHPLGTGLGSAVQRYGSTQGPGESALLTIFGELGVVGGVLYAIMYLLALYYGFRAFLTVPRDSLAAGFALVACLGGISLIPIMITSNIWGNFSLTFLFWWCAGLSVTLAQQQFTGPKSAEAQQGGTMIGVHESA